MSGSGSEEETYSIMFSSLRHPARRKILRMLSEKKMTFSQMLEELAIPSSHLTYHLENLGELVIKDGDGKYKLSTFGKASVSMMKSAEEVPDIQAKRFTALPLRWKSLYAVFIIAIVLLASMTVVQNSAINSLSNQYDSLKTEYDKAQLQIQQLSSWSTSATQAMTIIRDVMQIDLSKYQTTLESNTVEDRADLGNIIEEVIQYSFVNSASRFELTIIFRNGHFSLFQLTQREGYPNYPLIYAQAQPSDALMATKGLLERYQAVMKEDYVSEMVDLLASANGAGSSGKTLGNTKLDIPTYGSNALINLLFTDDGHDFAGKRVHVAFQNHVIMELSDDWFLYEIGDVNVNVSQEQAIQIAKNAAKSYTLNASGIMISEFGILDAPASAEFYPHSRPDVSLTLYPYWYVTLHLDKTYPGGFTVIAVGVWADTGKVANIQALTGQV